MPNIIKCFGAFRQRLWTTHCLRNPCRIVESVPDDEPVGRADWEEPP